jgi:hypothetical protein
MDAAQHHARIKLPLSLLLPSHITPNPRVPPFPLGLLHMCTRDKHSATAGSMQTGEGGDASTTFRPRRANGNETLRSCAATAVVFNNVVGLIHSLSISWRPGRPMLISTLCLIGAATIRPGRAKLRNYIFSSPHLCVATAIAIQLIRHLRFTRAATIKPRRAKLLNIIFRSLQKRVATRIFVVM